MRRFVLFLVLYFLPCIAAAQIDHITPITWQYEPGQIKELTDRALSDFQGRLEIILSFNGERTFPNTILPLEELMADLNDHHLHVSLLKDVLTDPVLVEEAFQADQAFRQFKLEFMLNPKVYLMFNAVRQYVTEESICLSKADQRLMDIWQLKLEKMVIKKNGNHLMPQELTLMRSLRRELISLELQFALNLNSNNDVLYVTEEELEGLNPKFKDVVCTRVKSPDGKYPIQTIWADYVQFMSKAISETARKGLYEARRNRALQNISILQCGIAVKYKIARLLGYETWVDYKAHGNLFHTADQIRRFILKMRGVLKKGFETEQARLRQLKKADVAPWDVLFYQDRLFEKVFETDLEQTREYFPVPKVVERVFQKISELDRVEFRRMPHATGWHPTVEFYEMIDRDNGQSRGIFFLDLYAREGKFQDASSPEVVKRRVLMDGRVVKPVTGIITNFPPPDGNEASLINFFDEQRTFEHELGHVLHEICSEAAYASYSGFLTEPDFAEVPSQVNEFRLMTDEGLRDTSSHYQTGEPMPAPLRQTLLEAERLQRYTDEMGELFLTTLDFELHTRGENVDVQAVYEELHQDFFGDPDHLGRNFPASFAFVMDPMYEGSHSIYLISKAIAKQFVEVERRLGKEGVGRFRQMILERGGLVPAEQLIRDYTGHNFSLGAYVRDLEDAPHDGLDVQGKNFILKDNQATKPKPVSEMSWEDANLKRMSDQISEIALERVGGRTVEEAISTAFEETAMREGWRPNWIREVSTRQILEDVLSSSGKPITVNRLSEGIFRELKRAVRKK